MSLLAGNPVHVYTLLWRLVTLLPGLRARVGARRVKVSTKNCGTKYIFSLLLFLSLKVLLALSSTR